jgi:pyruvate formate lyase activating enzyme
MPSDIPRISGYSLIADVNCPREVCSTIFLKTCNFRCPYCINRDIVLGIGPDMDFDEILNYFWLRKEKKIVISGGEPFVYREINTLFEKIKQRGIKVAVSTNGSYHDRLKDAIKQKLVDHVIMDIQTELNKDRYSLVAGKKLTNEQFEGVVASAEYLKNMPRYSLITEFRTTVCSKFVTKEDVFSIAKYLGYGNIYVLQPFTTHQTLDPSVAKQEYVIQYETLVEWANELDNSVVSVCFVRDV